jgi:uroporphyrinogen-III synthase
MKTILYLGTDPEHFLENNKDCKLVHYPVIRIEPRKIDERQVAQAYADLPAYTHVLFTSKNAVRIFFDHLSLLQYDKGQLHHKTFIAIGSATSFALKQYARAPDLTAQQETQEGLIDLLKQCFLDDAYILVPRSSLSRPSLLAFLRSRKIRHRAFDLYDTVIQRLEPIPDLNCIDEIVFTSPSTVKGFRYIFHNLPKNKQLHAIGPVTEKALNNLKLSSI